MDFNDIKNARALIEECYEDCHCEMIYGFVSEWRFQDMRELYLQFYFFGAALVNFVDDAEVTESYVKFKSSLLGILDAYREKMQEQGYE